jgi:hypothetical protein
MTVSSQHRAFTRSKYHAKKVKCDGITFDSKREYLHYLVLRDRQKRDGIKRKIGAYELDFRFWDALKRERRYQDVKGYAVPLSMWKIKHVQAEYGITVEIVK